MKQEIVRKFYCYPNWYKVIKFKGYFGKTMYITVLSYTGK